MSNLHNREDWLFDATPVMASFIDWQGRFQRVSQAFAERLGFSREDLIGRAPEDIATAACRKRIRESIRPLLRRTGELNDVHLAFVSAGGEAVEFVSSSKVENDAQGNYQRAVSVYTEIGDVARMVRRFRGLYQSSPAMLHTLNVDGVIVDVSDRWLEKLGYRRKDVIGRPISQFLSPSTRENLTSGRLKPISALSEFSNLPREMLTRDGQVVEVLVSGSTERGADGDVRGMFVASKDVTEQNSSARALRAAFEDNAKLRRELERERDYLREKVEVSMNFGHIIGSSEALKMLLARIDAVAQTPASVLIVGESGTGKELVAHAIHSRSARADKAIVKVNCASIPDELFESEFFGHVKGAFTGAHRDRVGRFALADGGTIFLDEVGEIPLALQGKLLRVLQEKEFEPVGDDHTVVVDIRVIAATNRDLKQEVAAGRFREDLFYRLSVFPVDVPPLRERGEDVVQLAAHLLRQISLELGREPIALSQAQADALRDYHWPGNVRELRNTLERAVILAGEGATRLDLQLRPTHDAPDVPVPAHLPHREFVTAEQFRALERDNLIAALEHAGWRVAGPGGAAALLGLRPSTLSGKIKSLNIERPPARRGRPSERVNETQDT